MTDRTRQADPAPARGAVRVLLLGSHGRLGGAIAVALEPVGVDVVAPPRQSLALDPAAPDGAAARWLAQWQPDVVVNCIGLTDVDRCERDPVLAQRLNTALPGALAREAAGAGARLIHFSTDYVFDGALRRPYREDDAANPLSVYGTTKLAGDRAVADAGCPHWVFRVSWLYGGPRRNLSALLLEPSSAGRTIRLANDRIGVPNPVQLLAAEVAHCIAGDAAAAGGPGIAPSGLYHLSCHGATTWHAFGLVFIREAIRVGRLAENRAPRVEGFAEATVPRPARRPFWSALDPSRYEQTFGRTMPGWEEAIALALCG
ncbi:MAG: NAD-dependent epimerase/dehydratase family protein [Burkholderiales bacterium]|nr:MAG: NAD-dependent epimerase/dehydratase family protein [Burkholderiales bacterium]